MSCGEQSHPQLRTTGLNNQSNMELVMHSPFVSPGVPQTRGTVWGLLSSATPTASSCSPSPVAAARTWKLSSTVCAKGLLFLLRQASAWSAPALLGQECWVMSLCLPRKAGTKDEAPRTWSLILK